VLALREGVEYVGVELELLLVVREGVEALLVDDVLLRDVLPGVV